MRAAVRRFHSPDIYDLERYIPDDRTNVSFLLQVLVGPAGAEGEEAFEIEVWTPRALEARHRPDDIVSGRHKLIVFEYDYGRLTAWLRRRIESLTADTWDELAAAIGELGAWELEGYSD